jgi:hypothetical protein
MDIELSLWGRIFMTIARRRRWPLTRPMDGGYYSLLGRLHESKP